jgi:hypothetical protein
MRRFRCLWQVSLTPPPPPPRKSKKSSHSETIKSRFLLFSLLFSLLLALSFRVSFDIERDAAAEHNERVFVCDASRRGLGNKKKIMNFLCCFTLSSE